MLGDRVIGICDSPIGLVRRACRRAASEAAPRRATGADYVGINHLGWLRGLPSTAGTCCPACSPTPPRLGSFEEGRLFGGPLLRALGALPNEYLPTSTTRPRIWRRWPPARPAARWCGTSRRSSTRRRPPGRRGRGLWAATRRRREESYLAEARDRPRNADDLSGGGYEEVALDLIEALSGGPPAG